MAKKMILSMTTYKVDLKAEQAYYKAYDAGKPLPEVEDVIMTNSLCCLQYAEFIIKGKLPDKMHNMMLLYAIKDPDDPYPRLYFRLIK